MVANKLGNSKLKSKTKAAANLDQVLADQKWQKVKIKSNVVSADFAGYEGLVGLEVLNEYDPAILSSKRVKSEKKTQKLKAKATAKPKRSAAIAEIESDSDVQTNDVGTSASLKRRKQKKRKDQKKQSKVADGEEQIAEEDEYPAGRFALLRPPPTLEDEEASNLSEDDIEDNAPELVSEQALHVDDLIGWNGLGVPEPVLRALAEKGFQSPTEIQAKTLPAAIMGKKDILGAAETGSGKTLAFGIPLLAGIMELQAKNARFGIRRIPHSLKLPKQHELQTEPEEEFAMNSDASDDVDDDDGNDLKESPLYAIVLTPTRELAVQVRDHLIAAAKYTGINVVAIFGGLAVAKQERLLRKCPQIVVATPGRFWELYEQGNKHLSQLDNISFLVIDETDRMVEKGHFEELRSVLKVLNADENKKQVRQNFVFSATLTLVHDLPEHMQKRNLGKRPKFIKQTPGLKVQSLIDELGISQPKIVNITRSQQTAQNLTECRLICPIDHKDYYLYYFVQRHPGRTIVFCNSIDCVKRLATLFGILDCNPLPLHANMIQKQRLKNLERFRDSALGLLIATDVAARGLDIPNVEHVIHYQVPRTSENYVHRSGRTARANKDGITVMFMEPSEVKNYIKLYRTLDRTEDLPLFPVSDRYLGAVKERVNLARELDREELKLKRQQTELGWMKKHAEEMEIIIDGYNDESGSDDEDPYVIERKKNRMRLESIRIQLKSLLGKHIFPRGFSFKYPTSTEQLVPNQKHTAVETMKAAIEDMKEAKKLRNKRKKLK